MPPLSMQQVVDRHGRSRLGAAAPVKNHGQRNLVQLVDCIMVDSSCNGKLMDNAFIFTKKNAIYSEKKVTLTRRKTEPAVYQVAELTFLMAELVGFTDVFIDSLLKLALVQQPISIASWSEVPRNMRTYLPTASRL